MRPLDARERATIEAEQDQRVLAYQDNEAHHLAGERYTAVVHRAVRARMLARHQQFDRQRRRQGGGR